MAPRVSIYRPQLRIPVLQGPSIQEVDVSSGVMSAANDAQQAANRMRATRLNEARLDATTRLEDLELEAEKQPWEQRAKFFEDGANKIRQEIEKSKVGGDRVLREGFADAWGSLYIPRNSQVKFSARKGEIDHNLAILDESSSVFARQAAQAKSEPEARFIMDQAALSIADAETAGFLTAQQSGERLRDFSRGVERNRARSLIEKNPTMGLKALQDTEKFANLREEDRLMLVGRAQSELQHRASMADHQANIAERQRKRMGEVLAKDGWDLIAQGKMSSEWLTANKATLDSQDYKALVHATQTGGGADSAPLVTELMEDVYVNGEDIGPRVVQALRDRLITNEKAASLLEENKQTQGGSTPAKRGKEYIATKLKVSDLNPAPGAPDRLAGAINDFEQFLLDNKKATAAEIDREAKDIARRYSIINRDEVTITLPLPKFARDATGKEADRNTFDVAQTRKALATKFLEKHGGDKVKRDRDPEYLAEARRLKLWENARKQAADAAAAAEEKAE